LAGYLTQIIASYDDSHFLKAMSGGAVAGAAIAPKEDLWAGAAMAESFASEQAFKPSDSVLRQNWAMFYFCSPIWFIEKSFGKPLVYN
jgi:hypothetical protein